MKDGLDGTIKGAGDVAGTTVSTVKSVMVSALKGTGDVAKTLTEVVGDVFQGAMESAQQVGTSAGSIVKNLVIGVVRGVGTDLGQTARMAMQGTLRGAREVGDDAMKAVEGTAR
ncbi:MAG: hypothetical protein EA351_12715 [Gemmatimonadales bacterium]|nr:MAG: hypothetical protein EA351_12715 [Gemmatimonadales bacterium]